MVACGIIYDFRLHHRNALCVFTGQRIPAAIRLECTAVAPIKAALFGIITGDFAPIQRIGAPVQIKPSYHRLTGNIIFRQRNRTNRPFGAAFRTGGHIHRNTCEGILINCIRLCYDRAVENETGQWCNCLRTSSAHSAPVRASSESPKNDRLHKRGWCRSNNASPNRSAYT